MIISNSENDTDLLVYKQMTARAYFRGVEAVYNRNLPQCCMNALVQFSVAKNLSPPVEVYRKSPDCKLTDCYTDYRSKSYEEVE